MMSRKAHFLAQSEQWYFRRLKNIRGPVCELACGFGRLLLPLARHGVPVCGCDTSPQRISAAQRLFAEEGLRDWHFEVCTMPDVPKRGGFHAVMLALNAVGYVQDPGDKRRLFQNIASMLAPGGLFLMDFRRGSIFMRLLRRWPGLCGSTKRGGEQMKSRLHWDRKAGSICETFHLRTSNGDRREFRDYFRFSSVRETIRMLRKSGFSIEMTQGAFCGKPYRPWSFMIAIVARRTDDGN